ncbi:MAG: hypothetical protein OXS47_08285 [Chloroflexota bacterium]|nr:hypothetical protein [Chloroflexota bacterium]
MLGDGDDADTPPPEHRLEGDGVLTLARKAGELPDENLPEGSVGTLGGIEHLAELRPIGDASALCLVNVLADDGVAVLLSVVPQRPQLSGDRQVDILAVAGDARVEGGRGQIGYVLHGLLPLSVGTWEPDEPSTTVRLAGGLVTDTECISRGRVP